MSMDVCSDSEVDGCCCSFRLWRSFDFKPWKYFLNLFLFASWLEWLVCVLVYTKIPHWSLRVRAPSSSSKILQHKTQTNPSNQDANKKRCKKYFQGLKSKLSHNLTLQQQPSTSESLQTSIDIEISMAYHRSSKLNGIFTLPTPFSYKTKAYSISTNQEKVFLTPALVLIMKIAMHHIKPS